MAAKKAASKKAGSEGPKKPTGPLKKSTTRRTGPSADALAGSATQKRTRASGQTKQSAMDAVTRRYKVSESFQSWRDNKGTNGGHRGATTRYDRLTGKETKNHSELYEPGEMSRWSTSSYPDKKTASVMAKRAAAKAATGSKIKKNAR